ncbi:hypothetical protein BS47DRAFT_1306700 [Hydnum rufescens UP504]|uniref:Uncharacterized protein n=1 Tax=Hydnum rufescens UP504 TaxID=1448309 RepID=A0A9P6DNL4_9AGAM|nr:hypothetical protein BS47DRAFT_1306700 [Hydnum rufescens UP504]
MAPEANVCVVQDKLSCHAQQKHAQAHRWGDDVLPSLIHPFMRFQREQNTGAQVDFIKPCMCSQCHHILKIICVHVEYLEDIDVVVYSHHPAAIQLVGQGLFPCSPLALTLAVSMDMLEFVSDLFVNVAPNEQAWAATLMKYLKACGHEFATGPMLLPTIKFLLEW